MSNDESEALSLLGAAKAVLTNGHFVFTSKRHGREYVNKDALYTRPLSTSIICLWLARRFQHDPVQVVVAPAVGGVILSTWVAYHLTQMSGDEVFSTYAERDELSVGKAEVHNVAISFGGKTHHIHDGDELVIKRPGFVLKRGYDEVVKGKRVLVVEDVLTSGSTVKKVVEATRSCGGEIIGVGALVNRGGVTTNDVGVPRLEALANITLDSWLESECPMCKRGDLVNTDVGKGRDFVARKSNVA